MTQKSFSKLAKLKPYGVDVILHGAETGLAEQHAQQLAAWGTYDYISPYNDPKVVAGQGSVALEILEQCAHVDNIFVSMGGGGLISGIGSVINAFSPHTMIYGVAAHNSKALAVSIAAGRVVETDHLHTLADAVAGGLDADTITLPLAKLVVDHIVECDEEEIVAALKSLAHDENMIVEGSAALAFAGFNRVAQNLSGQASVVLLCGANFDEAVISRIIYGDLTIDSGARFVHEPSLF